jgi:hypothetical protein
MHLAELKSLCHQIPRGVSPIPRLVDAVAHRNPKYPDEDYESFVAQLIETKKKIIQDLIEW